MSDRTLTTDENDILRFAKMHGQYTVIGIVMVQHARRLAAEGRVTMVKDTADKAGIGSCTVGPPAEPQGEPETAA
jgi:hypothetical protein